MENINKVIIFFLSNKNKMIGSGKSSLLRALAGLWHCSTGRIRIPKDILGKDFVFLPQIPYLIDGSLREQIMYPYNSSTVTGNVKKNHSIHVKDKDKKKRVGLNNTSYNSIRYSNT